MSDRGFALHRRLQAGTIVLAATFTLGTLSCRAPGPSAPALGQEASAWQESLGDTRPWVSICRPELIAPGYTLVFYQRRIPMLIDLNGRVVHSWPAVRAKGRTRLSTAGRLLYLSDDNSLREVDWEGRQLWSYRHPEHDYFPHHDLRRLHNGNVLTIYRHAASGTDDLLEIDRHGAVTWCWRSRERLAEEIAAARTDPRDRTHVNSAQALPENRHHRAGDLRFRPGNILISARELNAVFLIDRRSGAVVWRFDHELDGQHEAEMVPEGLPGAGNILIFDNGSHNLYASRRSRVLEIDPQSKEPVWQYSDRFFFTDTGGAQQRLTNGNTLISSSHSHRSFEVDPGGRIVWQWTPPFRTMRETRYAPDHCPQLAALEIPVALEVTAETPFIDRSLRRLALRHQLDRTVVEDSIRQLLTAPEICAELWIPDRPRIRFEYGLLPSSAEAAPFRAHFRATLRGPESAQAQVLMEHELDSAAGPGWHEELLVLRHTPLQRQRLCLELHCEPSCDGAESPLAAWHNPTITSSARNPRPELEKDDEEIVRQHLEALGYVE